MLLKYFYDKALAHASYIVGCQKSGQGIIVDPGRDIEQYLLAAKREGIRITGVAETHIHADYVSGARELAERVGATLYLSDEGPPAWKYSYHLKYSHQLLREGDSFFAGKVEFRVMHTPGHTPESVSFLLTDLGGGADQPIGIFTGDFVFVGSIGRPDLLEEVAGITGSARKGAEELFKSVERFKQLPDYLQIWPAHGAGSACGKGLGSIPSSTVGYETRFNPALQFSFEGDFVDYILSEQPEAPTYFTLMKQVNKEGPGILRRGERPEKLDSKLLGEIAKNFTVIDTGPAKNFAQGHVVGAINIPQKYLAAWSGWLVDYSKPIYLITAEDEITEAIRIMNKIGIEKIAGYFETAEVATSKLRTKFYQEVSPKDIAARVLDEEVLLIDVRGESEWNESHIKQAKRCFLAKLPATLAEFRGDCPLLFHCRSGGRSAIAASIASASGLHNVMNLKGGIQAWIADDLPVESGAKEIVGPCSAASITEAAHQGQAVFWNAECSKMIKER